MFHTCSTFLNITGVDTKTLNVKRNAYFLTDYYSIEAQGRTHHFGFELKQVEVVEIN